MKYDIKKHSKKANTARNAKLTPSQRKEIASIAAKARWAEHNRRKNHKCNFNCRCVCGSYLDRHSRYSECKEPKCESL